MKKYIFLSIAGLFLTLSLISLTSCNSGESKNKEVELNSVISEMKNDLQNPGQQQQKSHSHDSGTATINEVLHTEKYSYLYVSDQNNHSFWLAIQKEDVKIGDKISYEQGLMKKNFESKEFNRVFETIYLVSRYNIHKEGSQEQNSDASDDKNEVSTNAASNQTQANVEFSSNPKLSDLIANPSVFSNKEVSVNGKVTKVNFNIMGTNWVHLSNENSPGVDFTITTKETVAIGQTVSFKGNISVDKDFGAGYKYAVIMEKASLVK